MKKLRILLFLFCIHSSLFGQSLAQVIPAFDLSSSFSSIRDFSLASSCHEAYITVQSPLGELSVLVRLRKEGGTWQPAGILPFSGRYHDLEPFLSPDNLKLYFASDRPKPDSTQHSADYDIWVVERDNPDAEWGEPRNPGAPLNSEYNEFYPSVSRQHNIYFTSDRPSSKGKDDIFCSLLTEQGYAEPYSLSESVNTEGYEFNAFVAGDESFLIFSGYKRPDGLGSGDLYISIRDENKKWRSAKNLGTDINSESMDYCPFVDVRNGVLYFTSKRNIYQDVNNFQSIDDLVRELHKNGNSISTIYKIPFELKHVNEKEN